MDGSTPSTVDYPYAVGRVVYRTTDDAIAAAYRALLDHPDVRRLCVVDRATHTTVATVGPLFDAADVS